MSDAKKARMPVQAEARPPFPPFTHDTATVKVRLAEDGLNSRDPQRVALAYTLDSRWRNRNEFINGRDEDAGLMRAQHASINDIEIRDDDRLFHWDHAAPRPAGHPSLTDLGL